MTKKSYWSDVVVPNDDIAGFLNRLPEPLEIATTYSDKKGLNHIVVRSPLHEHELICVANEIKEGRKEMRRVLKEIRIHGAPSAPKK